MKNLLILFFISIILVACSSKNNTIISDNTTSEINVKEICKYDKQGSFVYVYCHDDDLKSVGESFGYQWTLKDPPELYNAVTFNSYDEVNVIIYSLSVFKNEIPLSTIPHEVSHVADFLLLVDEERAMFISYYTNLFTLDLYESGVKMYIQDRDAVNHFVLFNSLIE